MAGYTTKGVGVGTGLGLAICSKIIAKHNGKIDVESTINKGSKFIITIPSKQYKFTIVNMKFQSIIEVQDLISKII